MNRKCAFIAFIALVILSVHCQYEQSPCPGLFSYQSDRNSVFGHITLKPSGGPVRTVNLRANFTVAARLSTVSMHLTPN